MKSEVFFLVYLQDPRHVARGFEAFRSNPSSEIFKSHARSHVWPNSLNEDLVSVCMIIPLVSFHYWYVIFTGGCNSSTIEPIVENPRANRSPLRESLATCLDPFVHNIMNSPWSCPSFLWLWQYAWDCYFLCYQTVTRWRKICFTTAG